MTGAFQPNAFQSDAFQAGGSTPTSYGYYVGGGSLQALFTVAGVAIEATKALGLVVATSGSGGAVTDWILTENGYALDAENGDNLITETSSPVVTTYWILAENGYALDAETGDNLRTE